MLSPLERNSKMFFHSCNPLLVTFPLSKLYHDRFSCISSSSLRFVDLGWFNGCPCLFEGLRVTWSRHCGVSRTKLVDAMIRMICAHLVYELEKNGCALQSRFSPQSCGELVSQEQEATAP